MRGKCEGEVAKPVNVIFSLSSQRLSTLWHQPLVKTKRRVQHSPAVPQTESALDRVCLPVLASTALSAINGMCQNSVPQAGLWPDCIWSNLNQQQPFNAATAQRWMPKYGKKTLFKRKTDLLLFLFTEIYFKNKAHANTRSRIHTTPYKPSRKKSKLLSGLWESMFFKVPSESDKNQMWLRQRGRKCS